MADMTHAALEQAAHELDIAENALLCSSFHNAASRANQAARAARAAIAADRAQRQPVPPELGEVQELMSLIRQIALAWEPDATLLGNMTAWQLARAADLLESLSPPQPVPVSERLPGPEDCDAEGCIWLWDSDRRWVRQKREAASLNTWVGSYWLPAHALPLPGEVVKEPPDNRDPECVANWPECWSGGYDPRCCRFPKSCSCEVCALPLPGEVES